MQIKHTLAALSLAAVVALAGCGSAGDPGGDPLGPQGQHPEAEGGGQQEPGLDDAEQQPGQEEMPEADLEGVPDVVAVVDGEEITREEFAEVYEPQFQQAVMTQQSTGEEVDEDELKQQVADQLVDNHLLEQAAADAGIEASDEDIDATLEQIAQQNGLGSSDEVIEALVQQGQTEEDIRADAASQYEVDTFIEQQADIEEPSEEELQQQYDELQQQSEDQPAAEGEEMEVPPFEDVRDQLAEQATAQQQAEATTAIVEELREDAEVTINL